MILNESQYSNSVQKYGKDLVDAIVKREPYLSQRFLMKMCDFSYSEHIPFYKIHLLFSIIQENNLIIPNINGLSFQELTLIVFQAYQPSTKTLFDNPYYVSPDRMVEIYLIHNFSEIQRLPFNNSWCIKDEGDYNYHAFDKSTTMYLIYNKQYSKRSNMRYVMAEVYPKNTEEDEHTVYWSTNNDILNGSVMKSYIESLGDGASKIQLIPLEESLNNNIHKIKHDSIMKNKKVIRLSESGLHKLIEEAVSNVLILNENSISDKEATTLSYKVYWLLNDCYFRWKYVKGLSKREKEIIEVIGNAMSKIAKVVELLEPGRLPM